MSRPNLAWTCLALFALSLAIRLPAHLWVVRSGVGLVYDEAGYLEQAQGFRDLYSARWTGEENVPGAAARAYRRGVWPPLHPALLGVGLWWRAGHALASARFVVMLFGAAATPLVFLISARLADRRAALAAAACHALYPGFVAFSHLLWSESVYIVLLLLVVYLSLVAEAAATRRVALWAAAGGGLALGLAALTRAAVLPYLLLVPLWLLLARWRRPGALLAPLLAIVLCAATVAPWQATLARREGGRPMLLSTAAGYNLLLGNNPFPTRVETRRQIAERASRDGTHPDAAARALAWENIVRDPPAALGRAVHRLRALWQPDEFVLRHLFHAVYPPQPIAVAWLVVGWLAVSFLVLVGFALWGSSGAFPLRPGDALLLLLVVAGMVPPMLTVSNTRLALPLLALLLPFAGRGATELGAIARRPLRATLAALGLIAVVVSAALLAAGQPLSSEPSSYYRSVSRRLDAALGARTPVSDCVRFRTDEESPSGEVSIAVADGYRLLSPAGQETRWRPGDAGRPLELDVYAEAPSEPLTLQLRAQDAGGTIALGAVSAASWRRWQPTGATGVSYLWCGGGRSPVEQEAPSTAFDGVDGVYGE